jgi:hypothetical protein
MACDGNVAAGLRAALAAVCVLASACGDEVGSSTQSVELRAAPLRLPALGCFAAIARAGSCARDLDCAGDTHCVLDHVAPWQDRAAVPLTCAEAVGSRPAPAHCARGEECVSGLCGLAGVCLEPCATDEDCGATRHCRPIEARIADGLGPVMACARPIVLPEDVQYTLAPRESSLRKGESRVTVPGVADPAIVFVQSSCAGSGFDLMSLRSLDLGRDVYERSAVQAGRRAENTVLHDGSSLAALMFPNNPALAPSRLGLSVDLRSSSSQSAEVVVASRKRGLGVLDLNVFYAGGGENVVQGGYHPGEPRVATMLENLDRRFQELGLSLGEIREHDVVGALREELSVLEVPKRKVGEREIDGRPLRLDELFRLSAGVDSVGINVFLIRDMGAYIGIAGGIPGVLGVHGTDRSGVALAADVLGDLGDADLVLMHEIGHFLGLFHTTESSGTVLDPLSDTPECSRDADTDEDQTLSSTECGDHGADNLMFWTGAGTLLTEQQIAVMADSVMFR